MILSKTRLIDKLSDTTLMAFRVLIATFIGFIVSYAIFYITGEHDFRDRIYWVVFAVVSVSYSSNTHIIYSRSKHIAIFSFLGCLSGSLILMFIQHYINSYILIAGLCAISLVLNIYTMFSSYATSIYFVHIYLVMFFGLFVSWNFNLMYTRVVCVLIGTISILLVTRYTRSNKNRKNFIDRMYVAYGDFKKVIDNIDEHISNKDIISLVDNNMQLNEYLLAAKYEFDNRKKYYSYKQIIILMDELLINLKTHQVLCIQQNKHDTKLYSSFVEYTADKIKRNFDRLTIRYDRILINR